MKYTVGFEIEGYAYNRNEECSCCDEDTDRPCDRWDLARDKFCSCSGVGDSKGDGSIRVPGNGNYTDVELNSIVWKEEEFEEGVRRMMAEALEKGFETDPERCCGMHVHIGANTPQFASIPNMRIRMLAHAWDKVVSMDWEHLYQPNYSREDYTEFVQLIRNPDTFYSSASSRERTHAVNFTKYSALSFCHCSTVPRKEQPWHTVEFRLWDATTNVETILYRIRTSLALVKAVCEYRGTEQSWYDMSAAVLRAYLAERGVRVCLRDAVSA